MNTGASSRCRTTPREISQISLEIFRVSSTWNAFAAVDQLDVSKTSAPVKLRGHQSACAANPPGLPCQKAFSRLACLEFLRVTSFVFFVCNRCSRGLGEGIHHFQELWRLREHPCYENHGESLPRLAMQAAQHNYLVMELCSSGNSTAQTELQNRSSTNTSWTKYLYNLRMNTDSKRLLGPTVPQHHASQKTWSCC